MCSPCVSDLSSSQLHSFRSLVQTLTGDLRHPDICAQLHGRLNKFVLRRGSLPIVDTGRFLDVFSTLKHLQINLSTVRDLRHVTGSFVRRMTDLLTLQIWLTNTGEQIDTIQWEGTLHHINYEVAKRHIKIWK